MAFDAAMRWFLRHIDSYVYCKKSWKNYFFFASSCDTGCDFQGHVTNSLEVKMAC